MGRITTCIPIIVAVHAPSLETHSILRRHTSLKASDLTPPGIYYRYFRLIRGRAKKSGSLNSALSDRSPAKCQRLWGHSAMDSVSISFSVLD